MHARVVQRVIKSPNNNSIVSHGLLVLAYIHIVAFCARQSTQNGSVRVLNVVKNKCQGDENTNSHTPFHLQSSGVEKLSPLKKNLITFIEKQIQNTSI